MSFYLSSLNIVDDIVCDGMCTFMAEEDDALPCRRAGSGRWCSANNNNNLPPARALPAAASGLYMAAAWRFSTAAGEMMATTYMSVQKTNKASAYMVLRSIFYRAVRALGFLSYFSYMGVHGR